MFKFFKAIQQRIASDQALKNIVQLSKTGNKPEALKQCTKLVEQYPYDVQIRHRLATLQRDLGQEIRLPNITPPSLDGLR